MYLSLFLVFTIQLLGYSILTHTHLLFNFRMHCRIFFGNKAKSKKSWKLLQWKQRTSVGNAVLRSMSTAGRTEMTVQWWMLGAQTFSDERCRDGESMIGMIDACGFWNTNVAKKRSKKAMSVEEKTHGFNCSNWFRYVSLTGSGPMEEAAIHRMATSIFLFSSQMWSNATLIHLASLSCWICWICWRLPKKCSSGSQRVHWLCDGCTTCSPWKYGGGDMPMPQTIAQPQHEPLLVAIVGATCTWKSTNKNDFSMIGTHAYESKTHPPRRLLGYFFLFSTHPNSIKQLL